MPDQPSLFDGTPEPRPPTAARVEFLAGMMGVWSLPEGQRPKKNQRAELEKLARRFIADCDMVVRL